jgi:N-methylhydantoinase A/oxoprolinase/acetone carboxylase beta subunit/DUF917 family protein
MVVNKSTALRENICYREMSLKTLLIGVDVGGTNTDSVLVDPHQVGEVNKGVLSWNKAVTTSEVSEGIENGIKKLFEQSPDVKKEDITSVTIGTTHFINAVVEQDSARLSKVAVLRLCGPYSKAIPPFFNFPAGLRDIMEGHVGYLNGGLHVDGREIQSLDENEILSHIDNIKKKGIKSMAIIGVFSSLKPDQELKVKKIILSHIPDARVVLSHQVSGVGFIERENASILNASILPFAEKIIHSFIDAVENKIGLQCPVFLTQNDGTVLSAHESLKLPIRTFSSGTTNSMRGASFLGNVMGQSVIVIDVGGTTADVGLLLPTGFPRESSSYCSIGGVRMNFSMPQVESIGLGGGSLVRETSGEVFVGPESAGCEILSRALIFGGDEVTASDVVVSTNSDLRFGERSKVEGRFSDELIFKFQARVKSMLESAVDKMKICPEDIKILAVGGGSFIVPDNLDGASEVIQPEYYSVANAIGAAMGKISSEVHCIKQLNGMTKEEVLEELKLEARIKAIEKGALETTIEVVYVSNDPVPYVDGTYEFIVKTISDVDYDNIRERMAVNLPQTVTSTIGTGNIVKRSTVSTKREIHLDEVDYMNYKPFINVNREWVLSTVDLELLRIGTYILGCGGGGDPFPEYLMSKNLLDNGESIRVIDLKDIGKHIKGEGSIASLCNAGSPTVTSEQLKGPGMVKCVEVMTELTGKSPDLVFPVEIGGGNGLSVFQVATTSRLNVPVVDCDLMGRAYPTHWQTIPIVYCGDKAYYPPTVLSNGNGNTVIITESKSDYLLEKVMRASLSEIGCTVDVMNPPMKASDMDRDTIHGSLSLAWRIGRAVRIARQRSEVYKMPQAILDSVQKSGKLLFQGKIVGVERRLFKGHVWGEVLIESLDKLHKMKIPFKNENIYAMMDDEVVCSVPDLISVIDSDSGEAIGTPDYRYGLFVFVLGIAPSNKWTDTERGIANGGPKAFDLDDIEYVPISQYSRPLSVIDEFAQ